jgi:hypothetical protein
MPYVNRANQQFATPVDHRRRPHSWPGWRRCRRGNGGDLGQQFAVVRAPDSEHLVQFIVFVPDDGKADPQVPAHEQRRRLVAFRWDVRQQFQRRLSQREKERLI